MIGRAVESWELPLLRKAEVDGKREPKKVLELFNQYCKAFLFRKEEELSPTTTEPKELTPSEKRAITVAKKKAKKEANAEVARLKAERESQEEEE